MGKRVLLVDDDSSVESDMRALKAHGVDCDFCQDWQEALDLFQVNHYDVVISDFLLPGTEHGLKLLVQMRSTKPSTRIILISAYVKPGHEVELKSVSGLERLFKKPFDPAELAETVKGILSEIPEDQTNWEAIAQATIEQGTMSLEDIHSINSRILSELEE